ncbi:hypothetical protein AHiyo8_03390 [Arthrobacter sp. Hiyo8]|nr:hypothetical protein AHiyo8_03390 [Arthrobacter sp. Hiyo8]
MQPDPSGWEHDPGRDGGESPARIMVVAVVPGIDPAPVATPMLRFSFRFRSGPAYSKATALVSLATM